MTITIQHTDFLWCCNTEILQCQLSCLCQLSGVSFSLSCAIFQITQHFMLHQTHQTKLFNGALWHTIHKFYFQILLNYLHVVKSHQRYKHKREASLAIMPLLSLFFIFKTAAHIKNIKEHVASSYEFNYEQLTTMSENELAHRTHRHEGFPVSS